MEVGVPRGDAAASRLQLLVGNLEVFAVDGAGNVWLKGLVHSGSGQ